MYENGRSLYYAQSLKNERFRHYGKLKFCLLCYAIIYDLGQSRNHNLSSDPDLAGYLYRPGGMGGATGACPGAF